MDNIDIEQKYVEAGHTVVGMALARVFASAVLTNAPLEAILQEALPLFPREALYDEKAMADFGELAGEVFRFGCKLMRR